jgi:hypothetical protein
MSGITTVGDVANGPLFPFVLETGSGPLSDLCWTIWDALIVARTVESGTTHKVQRIRYRGQIVLEGAPLRAAIDGDDHATGIVLPTGCGS